MLPTIIAHLPSLAEMALAAVTVVLVLPTLLNSAARVDVPVVEGLLVRFYASHPIT